ncbi:MAG TPA: hypothetical protein VFR38_13875 [Gaiellaceae bacterium]|nr:hypothetical protein [Gaiellaceae bacterium]
MRTIATVALIALCVVPAATAKYEIWLFVSNHAPAPHQSVRVLMRTEVPEDSSCSMRLLAVAPGIDEGRALQAFIAGGVSVIGPTGPTFKTIRPTPRMGFLVAMTRTGPKTWRATTRFPRVGRWRLLVPNWCAPGFTWPPPAARTVAVRT